MLAKLKRAIRHRITRHFDVPEIPLALERLRGSNFSPAHIFDVGAHSGEFAKLCRRIWPRARLTCFEVLPDRVKELRAWSMSDGNAEIVECLLGAEVRNAVPFHEMETASSVLEEHIPQQVSIRCYPMKTIDDVVASSKMQAPSLLKLDVQGYEFEVLTGATGTLPSVQVILAEVNFMDIHKGVHLLDELLVFLRDHGFLAYDICGLHRRPLDSALWQADFMFVPKDSYLRSDKRWGSAAPVH
jgi:FkbM family methyltransferase